MTKKDNSVEGNAPNSTELDPPHAEAKVESDTGTPDENTSPAGPQKIDSAEAIYQAKQRIARARSFGPDRPLGQLKHTEIQFRQRTQAKQILSAPPKGQGEDLLIYQIDRALNTGGACNTIGRRIRRDNLALYASLDS